MKGTAPRGLSSADDIVRAEALKSSVKNRAENVMVVDMTRNDLGRIARLGSVRASSLYDVERYPGQWQMASSVTAEIDDSSLDGLFGALFPSGSVTGAPKHRSMSIIREVEAAPRGIYTGAIGVVEPGRAHFNVAIRTVHVDRSRAPPSSAWAAASCGIRSIATSTTSASSRRRSSRAAIRSSSCSSRSDGVQRQAFVLLQDHLARLAASAAYFGFPPLSMAQIDAALARSIEGCSQAAKVRLRVARDGTVQCDAAPLVDRPTPLRAVLATHAGRSVRRVPLSQDDDEEGV